MSYDLAVWEGPPPSTNEEVVAEFERLHAKHTSGGTTEPPSTVTFVLPVPTTP